MRAIAVTTLVTNIAFALSIAFVERGPTAYSSLWDGWIYMVASLLPGALAASRAVLDRREGWAWWLLAAGVVFNTMANTIYTHHDQNLDPVPFPAWSDAAYLASYVAFAVAMVIVTQRQTGQESRAVRLDGLVVGLSVAAVAVAIWFETILAQTGGRLAVLVGLAYPLFDVVFIVIIASGLAPIGFRPNWSSAALMAGAAVFALGDVIFLQQVAAGTYTPAGPLELTWVLGVVLFGFVPWMSTRRPPRDAVGDIAVATLAPAVAGVTALGVIAIGASGRIPALASWLAISALAVVLLRVRLTIRELTAANEGFRQARTDDLTGLSNRRGFYEATDARLAEGGVQAVMMIDLDGFKEINDSLGHQAGDHLLSVVAARFARAVPAGALVARLGGDEFGIVTVGDRDRVHAVAQSLQSSLDNPIRLDNTQVRVNASVGIARSPDDGATREQLIRAADVAMYEAKRNRHAIAWYTAERDPHTRDRLALIEELRTAIEHRAFTMHYQPAIDLATGRVVGMEALVRWNHPRRGMVPPDEFIPLAERVGLIPAITRAVLELSINYLAGLLSRGHDLRLSVNISALDLVDEDLSSYVESTLRAHGVPAANMTLEITETALCIDAERAEHVLNGLRDGGIRVSIDDFGVGYSSMSQLLTLPVDELKIDRSFVTNLDSDRRARAVLSATVELGRTLGLQVVAEGVETAEVLAEIMERGVDTAQGYYFSRPLPGPAFEAFLKSRTDAADRH